MRDCTICSKSQKEVCMAVKKQAESQQGLIWFPKCEWDALKQLSSFAFDSKYRAGAEADLNDEKSV
jgi:hypothetical protein